MCKINSLENEVLFAFLLHHLITLKRITVHFSNSKKKKKSISEVQADFILIYYNNKRTIISFLEASSLNHLKRPPQLQAGFCDAPEHGAVQSWLAGTAQGREGLSWCWGLGRLICHLMNPVPSVPRCSTRGWYNAKEARQCENLYYFTTHGIFLLCKKEKNNLLLGLYPKWQPKSLLLFYCNFTWCVHFKFLFFFCKPVKLTHVLRHVFTMDLETRDMLYGFSLSQNNSLYVSGAKQDHGSGPF